MQQDGNGKLTHILIASSVGLIIAGAAYYHQSNNKFRKLKPKIKVDRSGKVVKLERFTHYVARQLGFPDKEQCPQLNRLASDYINKREGCEDSIYAYFSQCPDGDSLFIKLVEEFERCILSYFAFHWSHADIALSEVTRCRDHHCNRDRNGNFNPCSNLQPPMIPMSHILSQLFQILQGLTLLRVASMIMFSHFKCLAAESLC